MALIDQLFSTSGSKTTLLMQLVLFFILFLCIYFIYKYLFKILKIYAKRTRNDFDDIAVQLFETPGLWLLFWFLFKFFSSAFFNKLSFYSILNHLITFFLVFSIAWTVIQIVKAASYILQKKLVIDTKDNLTARKVLTQLKVFQNIANTVIIIVAFSLFLLTFDKAKTIGLSLLTSAGVIGIIVGLAAQKSLGMILAGIQIAMTQPIRLDDVVIVEGEWGRIEEITLTYVVLKIWDERRLILPVNYFLEKPFQNWTRTSADITGAVFLYVGLDFPVDEIRKVLPGMVKNNTDWDGRILNVQVTNAKEFFQEIRVLLSSSDSSKNWDLRTDIREKLIAYINANYSGSFARVQIKNI